MAQAQAQAKPVVSPRGLNRMQAAMYIGVSMSLFDRLVDAGKMPHARQVYGRLVWDIVELDNAFNELPHVSGSSAAHNEANSPPSDFI